MKFHAIFTLVFIVLLLALSGCKAGNGKSLNTQGRPIIETPALPPVNDDAIKPTIASLQQHIFTPLCASCHGGANPTAGQNLSTIEQSLTNLVNVPSSNASFKRVLPGDAEKSYLYLKVTGNASAGARMPLGQPALEQAQINAIKNWIENGALASKSSQVPVVVSNVTVSNVVLSNVAVNTLNEQKQMNVYFSKAMNFDSLTPEQIFIEVNIFENEKVLENWQLPQDHIAINVINSHQLRITLSKLFLLQLPLQLTSQSTKKMQLSIQLNKPSISTLNALSGQQLDGDNNGIEGGVFHYELSL